MSVRDKLYHFLYKLVKEMKAEGLLPNSLTNTKTKDPKKTTTAQYLSATHKKVNKHSENTIYHNQMRFTLGKQVWFNH